MPLAEDLGIQDVEDVLRNVFGMEGELLGNGEFRILCPVHEQDGGSHSPSCDVNLKTGQWHCFSCSASSDIIGLGKLVLGRPRHAVEDLLRPNDPSAMSAAIQGRVRRRLSATRGVDNPDESERAAVKSADLPPLGSYRKGPMDAMLERGFTKATLKAWGIRFAPRVELTKADGNIFTLSNNVAIPIIGMEGEPICWCYRATKDSDAWQIDKGKYIYTPGLVDVLNRTWFGLYQHQHERDIVVVEGALDAIWCWQNGIPAVAMLGTSSKQFEKLEALSGFRSVTIIPDRDEPGLIATVKLGDRLQSYGVPVRIALYQGWMRGPQGKPAKDPQDLCPLDLELVHFSAMPWQVWLRKPGVRDLVIEIRNKTEGKNGKVASTTDRR